MSDPPQPQPPPPPPRKFPAPCWTQEETVVLIEAYRERWYALRRGYLRTADWDAVAADVGRRCPNASPAKTSAQCRHKMEKLRQRYRAEKQRSLSFPGRFFSTWIFFENMDSMEIPSLAVRSNQSSGNQVTTVIDQHTVPLGFKLKNSKKIDGDSNPVLSFNHDGVDPGDGFRVKNIDDRNSVTLGFRSKNFGKIDGHSNPNFGSKVMNGYSSYLDNGSDEDVDDSTEFGDGFRPPGIRGKKYSKIYGNSKANLDSNHDADDNINVAAGRFRLKIPIDQKPALPGFRGKKHGMIDPNFDCDYGIYNGIDANGFSVKAPKDRNSVPLGFRAKNSGVTDGNSNPNLDSRGLNGFSSLPRPVFGKKSDSRGVKREGGLISDMVSSIKMLGEGFVKMEKMKMEMAREIEQMRMEMEMKRSELILESQQQIVDAFVKALLGNKKQKMKVTESPDS
ncbi:protein FIP2-like [Cornus florida]|uniref:protein FIP2-like n=1 Tax=Cornus florida TaxID=4283 RepID=UPI0028972A9D|nr:protein FIP2-like [Cornus florida]